MSVPTGRAPSSFPALTHDLEVVCQSPSCPMCLAVSHHSQPTDRSSNLWSSVHQPPLSSQRDSPPVSWSGGVTSFASLAAHRRRFYFFTRRKRAHLIIPESPSCIPSSFFFFSGDQPSTYWWRCPVNGSVSLWLTPRQGSRRAMLRESLHERWRVHLGTTLSWHGVETPLKLH